jgi:hypothetical protein
MPNTSLTADIIAKEALVILENELAVFKSFYRAHESEYSSNVNGYKKGETISIRRPADFTVRVGANRAVQDAIEGKVALTVDQQVGVDFQFTSTELTLRIEDLGERVIKPAMSNLINYITSDILTQQYRGTYNWVGTPGTRVTNFAGYSRGPERLDEMAVPQEERTSVLCPNDFWGLVGGQTALYIQDVAKGAYRSGELGMLGGINTMMSQVTPSHTVGPLGGAPLVNGAGQVVTYDAVKNTWASNLITNGWTAAAALRVNAGDVFTIAGVFMVNPKTKANTSILQQFVVNANGSSDAGGALTMSISPPIIIAGPYQTVSAAPAAGAALTFFGAANTTYRQNMAYHKNCMALAMVPMEMPPAAYGGARKSYKDMNVRVIPTYDGATDVSSWRLDVLYGRRMIDPRLATRFAGS